MKGKILGFDSGAGTGAINGEDGKRYSFGAADFKAGRAAASGEDVDFVPVGAAATEVYPLKSAATVDLSGIGAALGSAAQQAAAGSTAQKGLELVRTQPQTVLAALMLFAAVLLTWSHVAMAQYVGRDANANMLGFPGQISEFKQGLQMADANSASDDQLQQMSQIVGQEAASQMRQARDSAHFALFMMNLAYLAWLVPVGAAFLIYSNVVNKRNRTHELVVGALAIGVVVLFLLGKAMIISAIAGPGREGADMVGDQIALGFGGWIVGLTGVGLVLTGLGVLRVTPGLRANTAPATS
jgi:hypothetical protein